MALLTDENGVKQRHKASWGPYLVEIIHLEEPDTGDTVETRLQGAEFAIAAQTELSSTIQNVSAVASGKIVTIGSTDGATDIAVLVFGY